jgi:hypothetical protein
MREPVCVERQRSWGRGTTTSSCWLSTLAARREMLQPAVTAVHIGAEATAALSIRIVARESRGQLQPSRETAAVTSARPLRQPDAVHRHSLSSSFLSTGSEHVQHESLAASLSLWSPCGRCAVRPCRSPRLGAVHSCRWLHRIHLLVSSLTTLDPASSSRWKQDAIEWSRTASAADSRCPSHSASGPPVSPPGCLQRLLTSLPLAPSPRPLPPTLLLRLRIPGLHRLSLSLLTALSLAAIPSAKKTIG